MSVGKRRTGGMRYPNEAIKRTQEQQQTLTMQPPLHGKIERERQERQELKVREHLSTFLQYLPDYECTFIQNAGKNLGLME